MALTEHKRVKHGETPGQINRALLTFLREVPLHQYPDGFDVEVFPWQHLDEQNAKAFRRYIKAKGRAVQRQRDRKAIRRELVEAGAA